MIPIMRCSTPTNPNRVNTIYVTVSPRGGWLGESLAMIGKPLGHRKVQKIARYAHLAHDSAKASAARVAENLRADMAQGGNAVGVT